MNRILSMFVKPAVLARYITMHVMELSYPLL